MRHKIVIDFSQNLQYNHYGFTISIGTSAPYRCARSTHTYYIYTTVYRLFTILFDGELYGRKNH